MTARDGGPAPAPADAAPPPLPVPEGGDWTPARLLRLHETMLLARLLDRRLQAAYRQGVLQGGVYSQEGNEAVAVGAAMALAAGDCLLPMHRGLGARLAHGDRVDAILAQLLGRGAGPTAGRDSGLHHDVPERRIFAMISHLGTQVGVAAGAAMALRYRGGDRVALNFLGDGATAGGDFHEGLNFAAVLRLPMILVIENNLWAYGTPNQGEFACGTLDHRGQGYGIPAATVDGTDPFAVHAAVARAVARARAGEGPSLIEARAMRLRGHSEADPAAYVPAAMLAEGRRLDPVPRLTQALVRNGVLAAGEAERLQSRLAAEVAAAFEAALALPAPEPETASWGRWSEEGHPSRGQGVAGDTGAFARTPPA